VQIGLPLTLTSVPLTTKSTIPVPAREQTSRLAEFLQDYSVQARKSCGSALKFGVIAAGEADLYPRFGTTMEWDTAAGQAVLDATGMRPGPAALTPERLDPFLA
jgi:3'(2'), 5'-bisphosphate nucleotidase